MKKEYTDVILRGQKCDASRQDVGMSRVAASQLKNRVGQVVLRRGEMFIYIYIYIFI